MPAAGQQYGAPPPRRRRRGPIVAVAIVALVVVAIGVVLVMNLTSSGGSAGSVAGLEHTLDGVPVPPGAALVKEVKIDAKGDRAAYVERRYRLSTDSPGSQLRALLAQAHFRILDQQTNGYDSPNSDLWSLYASATSGDVDVLPPDKTSGGIEFQWDQDMLYLSLQAGDVD